MIDTFGPQRVHTTYRDAVEFEIRQPLVGSGEDPDHFDLDRIADEVIVEGPYGYRGAHGYICDVSPDTFWDSAWNHYHDPAAAERGGTDPWS